MQTVLFKKPFAAVVQTKHPRPLDRRETMNLILMPLVALSALLLVVGQARADTIVYSQAANQWGAYASQNDTTPVDGYGNFATVYDNFTLGSSASITSVGWTGAYFYGPPATGTITGFTLKLWSDVIDVGTGLHRPEVEAPAILTETVIGNAGETDLGITDVAPPYGGNEMYSYGMNLATPFAATGGTRYWLSIVADTAYPPEWGWETAGLNGYNTGPDGPYYDQSVSLSYRQEGSPALVRNISGGDFAFSFSEVPEPATMSLLAFALGGLVLIRKRK